MRMLSVEVPVWKRQFALGQLGNGAGHLHAGGTASDNGEGEQPPALGGIGFRFGLLEGRQHAVADVRSVLDLLEARRERLPILMAEIGVPRASGDHQVIVGNVGDAAAHVDCAAAAIDRFDLGQNLARALRWRCRIRRIGMAMSAGDSAAVAT